MIDFVHQRHQLFGVLFNGGLLTELLPTLFVRHERQSLLLRV